MRETTALRKWEKTKNKNIESNEKKPNSPPCGKGGKESDVTGYKKRRRLTT